MQRRGSDVFAKRFARRFPESLPGGGPLMGCPHNDGKPGACVECAIDRVNEWKKKKGRK